MGISTTLSSIEGLKEVSFEGIADDVSLQVSAQPGGLTGVVSGVPGGISLGTVGFAHGTSLPSVPLAKKGWNATGSIKGGASFFGLYPNLSGKLFFNYQTLQKKVMTPPAFGLLYLHEAGKKKRAVLDFLREQDGAVHDDSPNLPVPILTADLYNVSGEGLSGTFRAYRKDVPVLYDQKQESVTQGVSIDGEVGGGGGVHWGIGATYSRSSDQQLPWTGNKNYLTERLDVLEPDLDCVGCERYLFQFVNEPAPYHSIFSGEDGNDLGARAPLRPRLKDDTTKVADDIMDWLPTKTADSVLVNDGNTAYSLTDFRLNNNRAGRATVIQAFTNEELEKYADALSEFKTGATVTRLGKHHIGGFIITKPDGIRYVYGIPVYNHVHEEFQFSGSRGGLRAEEYHCTLADPGSTDGQYPYKWPNVEHSDEFLYKKSLPPYVTAYLLTSILGPDYIDIGSDGVSDDDLGYWIRFSYIQITDPYNQATGLFAWRAPFGGVAFSRGDEYRRLSNDRYLFSFGKRELWYLTRIDTKTHYAEFGLSPRRDGQSAKSRVQGFNPTEFGAVGPRKLDFITLYKKVGSTSELIQRVHLTYGYQLAPGVPNFNANIESESAQTGTGKLALRRVWSQYKQDKSGRQHPYVFRYAGDDDLTTVNPPYDPSLQDAWGSYRPYSTWSAHTIPAGATPTIIVSPPGNGAWSHDHGVRSEGGRLKRVDGIPSADGEYQVSNGIYMFSSEDAGRRVYIDYRYTPGFDNCDDADVLSSNRAVTPQAPGVANWAASAWNLTRVVEPSGRIVDISYEADDYAFVQNRPVMRLIEPVLPPEHESTCDGRLSCISLTSNQEDAQNLIYFQLPKPLINGEEFANRYLLRNSSELTENDYLYFKARVNLWEDKKNWPETGRPLWEYVSGYATIRDYGVKDSDGEPSCTDAEKDCYGWIQLNWENQHPFERAARQYLRLQRPDLILPEDPPFGDGEIDGAADAAQEAIGALLLAGRVDRFIKAIDLEERGKQVDLTHSRVRLRVPDGIKYGGGSRVNQVTFSDAWGQSTVEPSSAQGFVYSYRLEDGRSSGVATYEPSGIQDENPLRTAKLFSKKVLLGSNYRLFFQNPANESYFPAPSVGYSRVEVRTLAVEDQARCQDCPEARVAGVTVHDFYTARDYPTRPAEVRREAGQNPWPTRMIFVPFIGTITLTSKVFSQGYAVTTNDMHGKPKAVRQFAANKIPTNGAYALELGSHPVEATEYVYHDRMTYGLDTVERDLLDKVHSLVPEFDDDALFESLTTTEVVLGRKTEWFLDSRSHRAESWNAGMKFNLDVVQLGPFPIPIPASPPNVNYSLREVRTVVLNAVTHRTGLLKEVINTKERSQLVTTNEYFQRESGQPIVAKTQNAFGGFNYDTKLPAHWSYPEMGSAALNLGAAFTVPEGQYSVAWEKEEEGLFSFELPAPFPEGVIEAGDELLGLTVSGRSLRGTVTGKNDKGRWTVKEEFPVMDAENNMELPGPHFVVVWSRNRNLLEAHKGELRSLSDPTTTTPTSRWCDVSIGVPDRRAYPRVTSRSVSSAAEQLLRNLFLRRSYARLDAARNSAVRFPEACFDPGRISKTQGFYSWSPAKSLSSQAKIR
ncbi:MAG: hypothetical protein OEU26_12430, partial [Candidatus Tectomicrobia bacterium]|nr:hypothetical protein [Candidatus Tectomicrobia bacterium]